MSDRRIDRTEWLLLILSCLSGLGALGATFFDGRPDAGVLAGFAAAVAALLCTVHRWLRIRDRVFMHGFHAGYHSAQVDAICVYPSPCSVLDLARERAVRR